MTYGSFYSLILLNSPIKLTDKSAFTFKKVNGAHFFRYIQVTLLRTELESLSNPHSQA